MTVHHPADVPMPENVARLDRDRHDRPIPWFVHREPDGTPDFRVVGHGRLLDAHRFGLCWVCGQPRGRHAAFVIGPMCAVNRVSAEPPSHLPCAIYSARACPFLSTPNMRRRTTGLGSTLQSHTAGIAIERNAGVALVWSSRTWRPFRAPALPHAPGGAPTQGTLWNIGDPTACSWWARGRAATRAEVQESIDTGLPLLREACDADPRPLAAHAQLDGLLEEALALLPVAPGQPPFGAIAAAARER